MWFEQIVKESFPHLSSGQKKVAEYLLQNIEKAAFFTAVQIGREADVSETTVIRFAYALGFRGFSEMQAAIQQYLLESNSAKLFTESTLETATEPNLFTRVIERDIQILRQIQHQLNQQDVCKAADWLMEADQVLIVGYRASYAAAHWFGFILSMVRKNVQVVPYNGETEQRIVSLTDKSAVLVISFPRYTKETIRVAEACKRMGARIISATDKILSPASRIADITFTTEINIESGHYSISSIISLLSLLLAAIKERHDTQARMKQLEQLYSQWNIFEE